MKFWMQRYEQYTREDLEHVGSYAAIQHWELRGDYHLRLDDFDSAHYYYMKLDHPWNYVHLQGYERLMNLYNRFPDRDPDYELRAKFDSKYVEGYMDVKKDRFLENEDEYRQRNVLINHELDLEHERTLLILDYYYSWGASVLRLTIFTNCGANITRRWSRTGNMPRCSVR